MKKFKEVLRRFWFSVLFLALMAAIPVLAGEVTQVPVIAMPVPVEGERWEFEATTEQGSATTSDPLEGNFEVIYLGGKLEVFQIHGGQKTQAGSMNAEELRRMIAFGQDDRQYLKFPFPVSWETSYRFQPIGSSSTYRRTVGYKVVEVKKTDSATELKIRGDGQLAGRKGNITLSEWIYRYNSDTKSIVEFHSNSPVGKGGTETNIKLRKHILPTR